MKKVTLITGCLLAALTVWILAVWDRASLRYKLTYVVEVKGEVRSGSSVVEIRTEDTSKLPILGRGFGFSATGEAVVVDLGDGRHLFSLLNNAATLPFEPFTSHFRGNDTAVDVVRSLKSEKPSIRLSSDQLPILVTFSNLDNPLSVRRINPENFAATFGAGVRLQRVTLEITEEPVTAGQVEAVLPWLESVWPNMLDGRRNQTAKATYRLANSLGANSFSTDIGR